MNAEPTHAQSVRNARLIVSARLVSDFGAFLNMVALSTYVYLLNGSALQLGVFLACRVGGGILASLVGTPFYRRVRGRMPLIGFDLLRAGLLGLLFIVPREGQMWLLPLVAFGLGLGNALFAIGLNSQMPGLVNAAHRVGTNAWIASVAATGAVTGSLVSGLLVAAAGYSAVFALNIATYLAAALFILPLRMQETVPADTPPHRKRSDWQALRHGLGKAPVLAGMLLITMADTLGSAAHNVGFPILSRLLTPASASTTMGLLLASWALGKFGGARLASRLLRGQDGRRMESLFFLGVTLMSAGFIVTFQQGTLPLLLLFALPAGLGDGLAEVSLLSRLQGEPDSLRLPVFSLLTLLQMTGFGIGMLISSPFYTWWAPGHVVLLFHGIPLAGIVAVRYWLSRPATRRRMAEGSAVP